LHFPSVHVPYQSDKLVAFEPSGEVENKKFDNILAFNPKIINFCVNLALYRLVLPL
jgi:hypothetical protein